MRVSSKAVLAICSAAMISGAATAAKLPVQAEPIAVCMARAAGDLGFNGSMYARLGQVVVEKSFGASDAAGQVRITKRTRFNMASAGKMFTAVAIGRLVDRGTVQFDLPIGKYLPNLKSEVAAITVAQLLNHTSGLGDYFIPKNKADIDAARTATDLLPLALETPPAFEPGSRRAYSNSGFVVLGAIIEKITGVPYAEFVRREILEPLGMSNTRLEAQGAAVPMTRMSPEGMLKKAVPSPLIQQRASPAGGFFSTPSDISVFLTALADGRLVSHETLTALLLARADPGGGAGVYGYGFNVTIKPPGRVGHGGGAPGINAEVALYPETGWQLIALSNNDPPTASRMVTVLERAIFARDVKAACATALADPQLRVPTPAVRHD
jgi:CubicO group peptidase (beta-lactamase class C family)